MFRKASVVSLIIGRDRLSFWFTRVGGGVLNQVRFCCLALAVPKEGGGGGLGAKNETITRN